MRKSKTPRHHMMRADSGAFRLTGHDIKLELARTMSQYFAPVVAIYTEVGKAFQSATAARRSVNGHSDGKSR